MSNYPPSWFCPNCGHQNQLSFKHCPACGTALPPGAATSQPANQSTKSGFSLKWIIGIILLGILGIGGLSAVFLSAALQNAKDINQKSETITQSPSTPTPDADPNYQKRLAIAEISQSSMREMGCPDCSAATIADMLIITNPQRAPRDVASELLNNKKLKKTFKDAGFTVLRVKQQTGMLAEHFDYAIK